MPVVVSGDDVTIDHLVILGSGAAPVRQAECRAASSRPIGGGLRVSGSGFTLRKSILRNFTCYTALEITNGANQPTIADNVVGPNGNHGPGKIWSDGVTIHDTSRATVSNNLFIDNTDVQLIFGGCRDCRVENNRFRHSGAFASSSFAELMLQAWPSTSGNFSGTLVRGNSIDCGPMRRCGYGIMIGAGPWYKGRMSGAMVTGNSIANAMMAINLDGLTGVVEIRNNQVSNSGGRYASDCGVKDWPAVNISPASRPYVRSHPSNVAEKSVSTVGCLLNRQDH